MSKETVSKLMPEGVGAGSTAMTMRDGWKYRRNFCRERRVNRVNDDVAGLESSARPTATAQSAEH